MLAAIWLPSVLQSGHLIPVPKATCSCRAAGVRQAGAMGPQPQLCLRVFSHQKRALPNHVKFKTPRNCNFPSLGIMLSTSASHRGDNFWTSLHKSQSTLSWEARAPWDHNRKRAEKSCCHSVVITEEREINLNEIISFLLPNGIFYLLSSACQAGFGRCNIRVMEEGKNQTAIFPDIWKPDGKLSLRKFSPVCLPAFPCCCYTGYEKLRFAFMWSIYFSHVAVRHYAIRNAITRKQESRTCGWLKWDNS